MEKGLFTHICSMHLKYVVQQYSSFTSTWVASRAVVECFMGILFKIAVLLDRVSLLCSLQDAASVGTSSNIQCEFPLYVFLRCVCTPPSLCVPAVPKGQADQTGIPDTVLPRSLSRCWCCLPHSDLSHIHRSVCPDAHAASIHRKLCHLFVFSSQLFFNHKG